MSRPRRSVIHSTSTAPDRAASTLARTSSRVASSTSNDSSRGAWVTPIRTSTRKKVAGVCSDVAMATYVLVHGAWGGAHVWRKVRPLLRAAGHEVHTPSLTGIGERVHLTGPHVDLSVHIDDLVNTVLYEDLDQFLLVGYSYGGMVVTGSLAHIGDRVRELVYLDAFVPDDGQSVLDLTGLPEPERRVGAPWVVEPLPRDYDDPDDAAFDDPRRTPHPLGCFTERVHLPHPLETWGFGRTFIKATA